MVSVTPSTESGKIRSRHLRVTSWSVHPQDMGSGSFLPIGPDRALWQRPGTPVCSKSPAGPETAPTKNGSLGTRHVPKLPSRAGGGPHRPAQTQG